MREELPRGNVIFGLVQNEGVMREKLPQGNVIFGLVQNVHFYISVLIESAALGKLQSIQGHISTGK